jgi:membrane-bound lytic murein transglycosylase B
VAAFIDDMSARHGFERQALAATMDQVRFVDAAVQLVKPFPPGKPKNWNAYRDRFIEPIRIRAGVAFWDQHAATLAQAEARWGVPAEIIVGILGVETIYGRDTGNFRVIDALTTLAFAYPEAHNREARMRFFRGELENVLLLARENGMDPFELRGSYAGAVGLPQFMPSSIRQHAIDFDGDGRVDLRNSPVDAIGSIANFLVRHGWRTGEPIVFKAQVRREPNAAAPWTALVGRGVTPGLNRDTLASFGISSTTDIPLSLPLGLIDLQMGYDPDEYWVGGPNFFVITQYNRSYFYAMSVVELGNAIKTTRDAR